MKSLEGLLIQKNVQKDIKRNHIKKSETRVQKTIFHEWLKIAVYIHLQSYALGLQFHEPMYKVHKEINLPHKGDLEGRLIKTCESFP